MGQGSHLQIINNSDFTLTLDGEGSYQMEHWGDNFPSEIKPRETQTVYIEFKEFFTLTTSDDSAWAAYKVAGTDCRFVIKANFRDNRDLSVDWGNTINDTRFFAHPLNSAVVDLGWNHDGIVTLEFPPSYGRTDRIFMGQSLKKGGGLISSNKIYSLCMQNDGNLVLYDNNKNALWNSGTDGKSVSNCTLEKDGSLVIYDPNNNPIWSSKTPNNPNSLNYFLVMQDDGNLVIYDAVWATHTNR